MTFMTNIYNKRMISMIFMYIYTVCDRNVIVNKTFFAKHFSDPVKLG